VKVALAACAVVATASLALPSEPSYDPWAWLVWGRELWAGSLDTAAGPSWKPGTVAITALLAPLAALDDGLPAAVWLVLVRTSGLLALVLAGRLGARLAGRSGATRRSATVLAGAIAATLLALQPEWWRYLAHGNEIPVALALALGAVDRQLAGRPRAAFALGVGVVLLRPEVAPLLGVHGAWLWWREADSRPLIAAAAVAVAALWLVPEWAGSGDPLGAWRQAAGQPSWSLAAEPQPWVAALARAHELAGLPLEAGMLAALVVGLRGPRRLPWPLLLSPLASVALVIAMTQAGFSGSQRYFALPLGMACVVGGAASGYIAARRASTRLTAAAKPAAAALLVLAVAAEAGRLPVDANEIATVASLHAELERAVDRLPARGTPAVNRPYQTHMAWITRRSITAVERGRPPTVVVTAPARLAGVLGDRARAVLSHTCPVARVGDWRVRTLPAGGPGGSSGT
jgi:hypothetical protein